MDAIIELVAQGVFRRAAAATVDLPDRTFYDWLNRYPIFREKIEAAELKCVTVCLKNIHKAAEQGRWQAAAWVLERRFPEHFSQIQHRPADKYKEQEADAALSSLFESLASHLSQDDRATLHRIIQTAKASAEAALN
jgi:hypothetical protein